MKSLYKKNNFGSEKNKPSFKKPFIVTKFEPFHSNKKMFEISMAVKLLSFIRMLQVMFLAPFGQLGIFLGTFLPNVAKIEKCVTGIKHLAQLPVSICYEKGEEDYPLHNVPLNSLYCGTYHNLGLTYFVSGPYLITTSHAPLDNTWSRNSEFDYSFKRVNELEMGFSEGFKAPSDYFLLIPANFKNKVFAGRCVPLIYFTNFDNIRVFVVDKDLKLPGLSGAPIIDKDFTVIGVLGISKMALGSNYLLIKTLEKELSTPSLIPMSIPEIDAGITYVTAPTGS
jgi:hypothetical protein